MKQKPISFSLNPDNIKYIKDQCKKHRNKSHWMDDLITHLREKSKHEGKVKKITKSKNSYPSNLNEEFEKLWAAKGKKGAKQKAKDKFKQMLCNSSNETCIELTTALVSDIESRQNELGMPEMHLTTYLNQSRWEQ